MRYIKNKTELDDLLIKLKNKGLDCNSLLKVKIKDYFNNFLFIDEGHTLGNIDFYEGICRLSTSNNDKLFYMISCENDYDSFFDIYKMYPLIEFRKNECKHIERIKKFIFYNKRGDSNLFIFLSSNIIFFPVSLSWIIYIDKSIELALIATKNDHDTLNITNLLGSELFIPFHELDLYVNDYKKADILIKNFREEGSSDSNSTQKTPE